MPLGLEALDMLRIEAGLVFAGYEFDDQIDPFEAGIGFTVGLKTTTRTSGAARRSRSARAHPQRVLVGLELEGNEPAGHGDGVHVGRQQVGVITSGTRSPILEEEHRALPPGRAARRARDRGRGREARRPPEAHPRHGRRDPLLRPGEDPPAS